jgi:GH25 family lysozyme M1 (1,4-beta-N-acetylmuramidase)
MKFLTLAPVFFWAFAVSHGAAVPDANADLASHGGPTQLEGYDVGYYDNVNWQGFAKNGTKFAYVLATDSSVNLNQNFYKNYQGASRVGLTRGAVHNASPYSSTAIVQVNYFLGNGGKWKKDGKTLPGALSIGFAPSRQPCWGFTPGQLKDWIWNFSNAYKKSTGVRPVIRTNTNFWTTCVSNTPDFASKHKLWLVTYQTNSPGTLPAGWSRYTFWQYKDLGSSPSGMPLGNLDKFNGNKGALHSLALGQ